MAPFWKKKQAERDEAKGSVNNPFSYRTEYTDNSTLHQIETSPLIVKQGNLPVDNKAARLMELVGKAIDEWAKEYGMEQLPKHILFQQAFEAMKIMEPFFLGNNYNDSNAPRK